MIDEREQRKSRGERTQQNASIYPREKNQQINLGGKCAIQQEISLIVKNRRYAKLKKMREEGFFEEQDIMLRYPTLYYQYVGKYKKNMKFGSGKDFNSMSTFLQSQIINSQYRRLMEQEKQKMDNNMANSRQILQKNQEEIKSKKDKSEMIDEMEEKQQEQEDPFQKCVQFEEICQEDLELQEQALLDALELDFLNGRLPGIDYKYIDQNEELDDVGAMNQDLEDQYFDQISPEEFQDPQNNTGIQDF